MRRAWLLLAVGGSAVVAGAAFLGIYRGSGLAVAVAVTGLAPVPVALVMDRSPVLRAFRPFVAAAVVALATALLVEGPGGLGGGTVHGWARTLDAVWPVHATLANAAWVPILTGLASIAGVEVAARTRWTSLALTPPLLVLVLSQAYDARSGRAALPLAAAFAACAVVALAAAREPADPDAPGEQRLLRGLRLAVPLVLGVAIVAPAVAAPDLAREPYLLKEHRPVAELPDVVGNPLGQIADLLAKPDTEVFRTRTASAVDRWTLAVLDTYDGEQWRSSARFRPLGAQLPEDPDQLLPSEPGEAVFKIGALPGPWLPTQPRTRSVTGADVGVDPDTGTLVHGGEVGGVQYRLSWAAPDLGDRALTTLAVAADPGSTRLASGTPVPEQVTSLATELTAGSGPTLQGAFAIEKHLRDEFVLVTGGARIPSGHAYAHLVAFLDGEDRQGTTEQFAAAYALLARTAGIPARVVVGFRQPERAEADGTYVVRGRDALAWPEIRVSGLGWVPLDPVPAKGGDAVRRTKLATATHQARLAAATPAPREPRTPGDPRDPVVGEPQDEDAGAPPWALGVLVLVAPVGVPVAKKVRRLRRRRGGGDDGRSVVGAWLETRDRLREHGVAVPDGATAYDVAGQPDTEGCADDLLTIAGSLDLALWSGGYLRRGHVAQAWQAADAVARHLRRRSRARAIVAAFDPRALVAR